MKRLWRYLQFWSVLVFAAAVMCLVIVWLQGAIDKQ